MTDTCKIKVRYDDWHSQPCGKPATSVNKNGIPVCGVHSDNAGKKREINGLLSSVNTAYRENSKDMRWQLNYLVKAGIIDRVTCEKYVIEYEQLLFANYGQPPDWDNFKSQAESFGIEIEFKDGTIVRKDRIK